MNGLSRISLRLFAVIYIGFASTCWAKCEPLSSDIDKSIFLSAEESVLHVKNTLIAGRAANKIIYVLTSHRVRQVVFECVLGGLVDDVKRLMALFQVLDVKVVGACNSACATLALQAKNIILVDNGDIENPTSLMIHATFKIINQQPTEDGIELLEFYSNRLPSIPKDVLRSVLTEKIHGNYGLIITRSHSSVFDTSGTDTFVCRPYPVDCQPVPGATLRSMNIGIE